MKTLSFLFGISWLLISTAVEAQISAGGQPVSTLLGITTPVPVQALPTPNRQVIQMEDERRAARGDLERFGKIIPVDISIANFGVAQQLPDNGVLWRVQLKAPNALATNLYFDQFDLAPGALLFVYNNDQSIVLGAFTSDNNHPSGTFATGILHGSTCWIELYEPAEVTGQSQLHINEMGYAYRHIRSAAARDFGDGDPCEVNVNCEEGNNYQDIKRAVTRILVKAGQDQGWCTGSLVNTVPGDCKPYILTADHCTDFTTPADILQWIFYFNYESPDCDNPAEEGNLGAQSITGATTLAFSDDNGGDSGSDFHLLELESTIPESYQAFSAGWDRIDVGQPLGVCIHHPDGDIKKISTFTTPAISESWAGTVMDTHWEIDWATTTNGTGVTEGGSSGSPLLSNTGRIVGTLTGGGSSCADPVGDDLYGKFGYHWAGNGSTPDKRLMDWLDPDNTGTMTIAGKECGLVGIGEQSPTASMQVFPNPTSGSVKLQVPASLRAEAGQVAIYNPQGQLLKVLPIPPGSTTSTLDLDFLADGLYFITLQLPSATQTFPVALVR